MSNDCNIAKERKFVQKFIVYYKKTWINGNYPKELWNFFDLTSYILIS